MTPQREEPVCKECRKAMERGDIDPVPLSVRMTEPSKLFPCVRCRRAA